jgi:hypothetical protein
MSEHCDELVNLQQRVDALEARLAVRRKAKLAPLVAVLLVGWTLAQTGSSQGAGEQPVGAATPDDAIRKGPDGITRIDAPFQVIGADGKVLLHVSTQNNINSAVSVWAHGGAGAVTVFSSDGQVLTHTGRNNNGYGMFVANDATGRFRAIVHGYGGFHVYNDAQSVGAQLSMMEGKGMVGVWGADKQRIATLSEGASGAGELTVYDKGRKRVALITADPSGNGGLELFGAGKATAAVDLGIAAKEGSGLLSLANSAGQPSAFLTGAEGTNGNGAVVLVRDGKSLASLTVNKVGAGELILANSEGSLGLHAVGTPPSLPGRGGAIAAYNNKGAAVAGVGTNEAGDGIITIMEDDKNFVSLHRNSKKAGEILLNGANGELGVSASADTDAGRGVVVYNSSGEAAASLQSNADGKGSVSTFANKRSVATMGSDGGAGYLIITDDQGKTTLGADGGTAMFEVFRDEQTVATLGRDGDGHGLVTAFTKAGAMAAELGVNQYGSGIVLVRNTKNVFVAGMTALSDESGSVVVHDSAGAAVAEMGSTPDKRGEIKVLNTGGKMLASMAAQPGGLGGQMEVTNGSAIVAVLSPKMTGHGHLQLRDPSGNPIVEAGMMTDGRGVVLAGPKPKCPSGGLGKVPPGCIMGGAGQ